MDEKHCSNCLFGKLAGYGQAICGKRNRWESELYSCEYWKAKDKEKKMLNKENMTLVSDFLDFNYENIAFNVNFMKESDRDNLIKRLKHDYVNHLGRMDKANYFAIWNCDFQDFKTIDDIYFDSADHNYEIVSLYLIDDEWYYQTTHKNMQVRDDLWM